MRVAGLMSGTSLDAIDVAIVDIEPAGSGVLDISVIVADEEPWPSELRSRLAEWLADPTAAVPLRELAAIDMEAGAALADALFAVAGRAGVDPAEVDLVASHGQTVHHLVDEAGTAVATLQIGQPSVIAERVGCPVVADFRPRDIAAGGQGAPLVARFDALAFGDPERDVAVLNLGGIANITVIAAGRPQEAVAWDTGPANAVLDALARREGRAADASGDLAAAGTPDEAVLEELLADPWFAMPPPKSTGRERFGDAYAAALAGRGLSRPDLFATATALGARATARGLRTHAPTWPAVLWVSGGGVANPSLMRALSEALATEAPDGGSAPEIRSVRAAGIPSGSKEAIAFAFLGHETLHGRPGSLVGATGARHPSVLGAIWPGRRGLSDDDVSGAPRQEPVRRLRFRDAEPQSRRPSRRTGTTRSSR